jgi:heat shock protein HslJ
MSKYISILLIACLVLATSCSSTRTKKSPTSNTPYVIVDSIEYYETDFEARQKNYRELLIGSWTIDTMHRQARLEGEQLSNVFITFSDSTFTGNGGCNQISGKYTLKGTSIRFHDIISTKMACERLDKEVAFLQLLQSTVSAYTVTQNVLWLRDGSSNIVFHASKR